MFSISAINDTDSKGNWEPLAPTKEAQEFRLSQTYHEGLHMFQAKEYVKARELLESVLKDPLMENVQVDGSASDGHLLQLRFLALKNLASVFLQQGSSQHENALQCYLQAAEIDEKDSVIWNQLGTLSCSMGVLSISRWAFEQGLICSPNNWNCMEKLLEVLIAIGDEVACLSVAELILRNWPSHSRALHVKKTIEDPEPIPFAPKGIDKLEPRHVRLKFRDKRKLTDEGIAHKKQNLNLEIHPKEASWVSLAESLLGVLLQECGSEDVKLIIRLPSGTENTAGGKESSATSYDDSNMEISNAGKEKDLSIFEEQPQERRSSRLERLRNRKPEKEDLDGATDNSNSMSDNKNQAKLVRKFLEPFVTGETAECGTNASGDWLISCRDQCYTNVCEFVRKNTNNFGAYHMSYLLLEAVAIRGLVYEDGFIKFLDLEKMTRHWAKERTPECNLFLSELYYGIGSSSSDASRVTEMMSEASYHLCKIIESAALNYPHHLNYEGNGEGLAIDSSHQHSTEDGLSLVNNNSFWVRFFWLRGRLSLLDGNMEKAHDQFTICLSLLATKKTADDDSQCVIRLAHRKVFKEITMDRLLHQINILKVDMLMETKTLTEMMEKEMYTECMNLLAPLVLLPKDIFLEALYAPSADTDNDGITSLELLALDILLKACEKSRPMNIELYLKCHQRKLQALVAMAGYDEYNASCRSLHLKLGPKTVSASDTEIKNPGKKWNILLFEEVKSISKCASQIKKFIDSSVDSESIVVPSSSISDIQSSLLSVMCSIAVKKSSGFVIADKTEINCFVVASAAVCKLQHLNLITPVKTQVDLIVATHDMLAEFGLCCAGEDGSGEEGLFLKFSIKHLLALSMKLKSNPNSLNEETTESGDEPPSSKVPLDDAKSDTRVGASAVVEATNILDNDSVKVSGLEKGNTSGGKECEKLSEGSPELTEDEKEELELSIDTALDQCFFCLYGLNIRSDSSYEDDLATHRNTCRGDYQTKEQCADVFQYILPCAKASSKTGLVKLRRVLRAIRKHFPEPPEDVLAGNPVEKFLDDPNLCEDKLSEEAGSDGFLETITKVLLPKSGSFKQHKMSLVKSSEPYMEIYRYLYYFLALSEELSATDKWPGFVLTKEGEEFVQQNAKLFKYDLLYNPRRFESWQRLGNSYDEEVDLLLNDGSKHINVTGWRKSDTLSQRVETSRKRSRRCLLMSLALAKTSTQQYEIHELLALVYYDSLQNVVPFFDQRSAVPVRDAAWIMCCENSMRHFKKASAHTQDWSHAYYIGKICEKLGFSIEVSLSYYEKAIALNPTAVDPVYRMHASRLKKLFTCGKQNLEVFKVLSEYSFSQSNKDAVKAIVDKIDAENSLKEKTAEEDSGEIKHEDLLKLEVWRILYSDCLAALEACVEGDLKHFHKARYMLAQGLYKRGDNGDLDKAKDELSFCFKSSRSSFTINMWEIDSMAKKGRRKTPGITGSKKILEVNLPESSRKFITCIRKYLLFYLKLLEETREISTLERAYASIRADRRFSLCIEDLVPVALGRYVKALVSCVHQPEKVSSEQILEKLFALFIEQGSMWPDICILPEIKSPETSVTALYGYLHEHITSLEKNGKLETLEAINEKLRKRFKNPKLSNSTCARVCRHASIAWCRALVISLGQITPAQPNDEAQSEGGSDTNVLLFVDLQTEELWSSAFEDPTQLKALETKWSPVLSKLKCSAVKKASGENLETASVLLKSAYNFYRESSCVMPPSGVNLYLVPSWLAMENRVDPNMNTNANVVEVLDLSVPRKLILWAYTLLYGRHANISLVVKHCEENLKSKMRKGAGTPSTPSYSSVLGSTTPHTGGTRNGDSEATTTIPRTGESQKGLFGAPQLHHCNSFVERSSDALPINPEPDIVSEFFPN